MHDVSDTGRPAPPRADDTLRAEVLAGLAAEPATLPCKLFYDEAGSRIYEEITALDAYYPFAAEVEILREHGAAIAAALGPSPLVVEYGSGSSVKTDLLLDRLAECAGYVPIDISREHLLASARSLSMRYPQLEVTPLCADFSAPITLPDEVTRLPHRCAFFPGSTIGNFDPVGAAGLLRNIRDAVGARGSLLIGVDIPKDRATLELAYDDPLGVTARFNLNILRHVNRLFAADIALDGFRHEARWNETESRVEMHLRALRDQRFTVAGTTFTLQQGQTIWTESSYKYTPDRMCELGTAAGFTPAETWFDQRRRYTMHLMHAA